jgi:cell fate regulator YaaT (PSP1 superfamily)
MNEVKPEQALTEMTTQSNIPPSVVVQVNFQPAGEPYHFLAPTDNGLEIGAWVVVETSGGTQVGHLIAWDVKPPESVRGKLKPVLRRATGLDMARYQTLQQRGERLVEVAREELHSLRAKKVKAISAEFALEGDQARLFYTGNLSNKELNTLRRRLASRMNCRVTLHSMGPRDQAKSLGGYGICGEPRCCSRFLTEFRKVSIRMAKDQSISMAPTDTTGMCGRLRCCLAYEHQVYKDASKGFPKLKSRVRTPQGVGRVFNWNVLKGEVIIEIPPDGPRRDRERFRFAVDEVEVIPHPNK